jgi:hypothetical protein
MATKSDLDALRRELRAELALVRQESRSGIDSSFGSPTRDLKTAFAAETRALVLWLGSLQIISMIMLFTALKLT